jgi:hypothetical protein
MDVFYLADVVNFANAFSLMDVFNVVVGVISVIAAFFSFSQAKEAKNYRDELIVDRKRSILINAKNEFEHARRQIKKLRSYNVHVAKPRGLDVKEIIDSSSKAQESLMDHRQLLNSDLIDRKSKKFGEYIQAYQNTDDIVSKFEIAEDLYKLSTEIISELQGEISRSL